MSSSFNPFYNFEEFGVSTLKPPQQHESIQHRKHGGPAYEESMRDLLANMTEISGDPSGSNPEDYLAPDDAEVCWRVVGLANHLGWPSANDLGTMEVPRSGLYPVRNSRFHMGKAGLTKLVFFKGEGEAHRGYIFGRLGASLDQLVALCDDGMLRSYRGRELDRSNGAGWGRLPDPDLLKGALDVGKTYGVEYANVSTNPKSKTLAAKLLENVPIPGGPEGAALLEHFGLKGYKDMDSHDLIAANPARIQNGGQ